MPLSLVNIVEHVPYLSSIAVKVAAKIVATTLSNPLVLAANGAGRVRADHDLR